MVDTLWKLSLLTLVAMVAVRLGTPSVWAMLLAYGVFIVGLLAIVWREHRNG